MYSFFSLENDYLRNDISIRDIFKGRYTLQTDFCIELLKGKLIMKTGNMILFVTTISTYIPYATILHWEILFWWGEMMWLDNRKHLQAASSHLIR